MPDIHDVMDVTIEELSPEQQLQLKDAVDQFWQKCLMSFSKNISGVPYLKSDMPRVLLPGEPDTTSAEEKQEVMNAVQQTMENIMAKHNTAVLNMFRQMMVSIFGPGMEKVLALVSTQGPSVEIGETSSRCKCSAASAKYGRSTNPAASAKYRRTANPAVEPLSGNAQQAYLWRIGIRLFWSSTWLYLQNSPNK
jgi:hypothetical protein